VRLALIGLGNMGMAHLAILESLPSQASIAALADSHAPFADRAAERVPTAAVFHDPLDCVRNADVDAVVVATADDTHHGIVEACIARGLHVLCEKPLTTSAEKSLQLVNAERAGAHRLVQVGYMRRFDAGYQDLNRELQSGRVGELVLIRQHHRNPLAFITFNQQELISSSASHDIDMFRWLCGEEINEVSSVAKTSQDGSAVTVVLTLRSRSGVLGVMELSRGPDLRYDIGCEVIGSGGAIRLAAPNLTDSDWMARFHDAYRAQDAGWLAAMGAKSSIGPSAYDGYANNAVVDAALAALASGQTESVALQTQGTARVTP
jgi:myo-inositol 2-dehydrogenase / D-chiro-inositol 1-dehydrogenase